MKKLFLLLTILLFTINCNSQIIVKHLKGELSVKNVTYTYENKEYIGASFEMRVPI